MPAAVDKPAPDSTMMFLKDGNNRAKASMEGVPSGNTLARPTCTVANRHAENSGAKLF
jgi:hypothetical protein